MDFSKFDEQVNKDQLAKDVEEAKKNSGGDFPEIEEGIYTVKVDRMEIGETGPNAKVPGSPILKVQLTILDGEFANQKIFWNRVLFGTKNDAYMIATAVNFLESLEPSEAVEEVVFDSYSQFNELVMDVMEDIDGELTYEIEYDPDAFNSVKVLEALEA